MSLSLPPVRPVTFLTDADVSAASDWKAAIDALRLAYLATIDPQSLPPRTMARGKGVWLRSLTAISPLEGYMGCKLIAASPRAGRASYLISLFDQETMNLDALIDGNQITGIRTAATAAVAVDAFAPQNPLNVAILGSGFEARAQLTALQTVRSIATVKVFSPTPEKRQAFAEHFKTFAGLKVTPMDSPEQAVLGSDVVICAARARNEEPVLKGGWLAPGMTVVSIGSTLPEQREVDVEVVQRARFIVADMPEEVAHDTGDMLAAKVAGVTFQHRLISLGDAIGRHRLDRKPDQIVLYKSVGSALQDVVIAEMLLKRARARGLGTALPVNIAPVAK